MDTRRFLLLNLLFWGQNYHFFEISQRVQKRKQLCFIDLRGVLHVKGHGFSKSLSMLSRYQMFFKFVFQELTINIKWFWERPWMTSDVFWPLPTMSDSFYPITSNMLVFLDLSTYPTVRHHLWTFPCNIHMTDFFCTFMP